MQTEREYHWGIYKDVRITYFCWSNGKMTGMGETSRNIGCVVLRHGRTKTWRIFIKFWSWCLGDHQFKQEEGESVRELSQVCSQSVLTCLYLARIEGPGIFYVCQQTCKSSHKMDSGLRQTIGQIDFVHSSRKWLPTILSCGQHRSALSTGFIPRLRLWWRGHTMRKDMRRSALKDVVTEPARNKRQYPTVLQSLKHFVGCWTTNGWFTCSRFIRCTAGNCSRNHKSKPKPKGNRDVDQLTHVDYLTTDANSSQGESQLYIFEDNEAVIKMIKGRSPTMRHVPRTKDPNQICSHQKPTSRLVEHMEIHPRSNGTQFQRLAWMSTTSNEEELGMSGDLFKVCFSQWSWNDCLWFELVDVTFFGPYNKLARAVTEWTRACGIHSVRLIAYILHTTDHRQYSHEGNTGPALSIGFIPRLRLLLETLEDSKSTSVRWNLMYHRRKFVPMSWICKKQTSVSQSSTESEVLSLDAGLRMDGIPALDPGDVVIEVWHSSQNTHQAVKDHCRKVEDTSQVPRNRARSVTQSTNSTTKTTRHGNWEVDELCLVGHVVTSAKPFQFEDRWYIFEHNEAVIKIDPKGQKSYDETRVQNPQSCVGFCCLIGSTWTPKSKSNTLTPKTNSLTCRLKVTSPVMSGVILLVCSTSWILRCFLPATFFQWINAIPCRRGRCRKENQEKELVLAKSKVVRLVSWIMSVNQSPMLDSGTSYSPRNCVTSWNSDLTRIE